MHTLNSEKVVSLAEYISPNLAFRHSADDLFDHINNLEESDIVMDFSGIKFMGASFAHQYITNKKMSSKDITEMNISLNIIQMFKIVERRNPKLRETSN